jgi:hypothetical protein
MLIVRSNITLLITLHTSLIICQFMNVNGIHTLYRPKEKSQQIKSDRKKKKKKKKKKSYRLASPYLLLY